MERDLAGETIAGRYDVLELIGRGGMGAVYRAHDRELDELVALKVIRPDRTGPHMIEGFRHEVKLARRVTHVNIARTFELGFADGVMFCTMELVEGESLRRRLERQRRLSVAQAAAITRALCDGLAVAHAAGVIHRDIKPDNVLLARDGRVVLADFGVASLTAGGHGELSGTLEYMAPEQAAGEPATPATDVYALGLVLYEMVTGLRAFAGSMSEIIVAKQDVERVTFDVAEIMLGADVVPPALRELVARATARDLRERIASARELGRLLAPWLGEETIVEPRHATAPHLLHTVVVLAPRAPGDAARLHVAEGVHQELLRQLVTRPRVRVLPRQAGASVPEDATVVALIAEGDELTAEIRHDHHETSTTLQLPLEMRTIRVAADAIAAAVVELGEHADDAGEAAELLLRARTVARRGFAGVAPAIELLERARALAPGDWTVAAELAAIRARFRILEEDAYEATAELVRQVRDAAPHLAETHVAAGYVELHTGEPYAAALEFRRAIACSPYHAAGHEGLGRMLLEAGFLQDAVARLDDALAIAPDLAAVRWEIARAHALEQNWLVHDQLVTELDRDDWRAFERMRFAWWRGDRALLEALRQRFHATGARPGFSPDLVARFFEIALDGAWPAHRDHVLAKAWEITSRSQRYKGIFTQVAAEASGAAGDVEACVAMLEHAADQRVFDLHWLERCPLLEPARHTPAWPAIHTRIKERADSILDALYGGDQTIATS